MKPTDILGNIKLYNADNMEVMKTFKDKQFDLAIIDPPYGIETRGNAQDRFRMGKSLSNINDNKPNKEYINELFRVSKNQIMWGYNHLSDMLPSCREFIFWYKHNPVITFSDGELAWTSFQKTAVCFDYPYYGNINAEKFKFHPTTKPVQLYRWLLQNYAKEGDTILDTHFGSLSIGIACHDMKFDLTAIELDADYYEQAKERLINHQRQLTLF